MWCTCETGTKCSSHVAITPPVCRPIGYHELRTDGQRSLIEAMLHVESNYMWWDRKAAINCSAHKGVVYVQALGGGLLAILGATRASLPLLSRWLVWLNILATFVGLAITGVTMLDQQHKYNPRWKQCRELCDALEVHLFSAWRGLTDYAGLDEEQRASRLIVEYEKLIKGARK